MEARSFELELTPPLGGKCRGVVVNYSLGAYTLFRIIGGCFHPPFFFWTVYLQTQLYIIHPTFIIYYIYNR